MYLLKAVKTYKGLTDNDAFRNYPKMDMALFYYGYTLTGGKYMKEARTVYDKLLKAGIDVLYDDRDDSPGAKFAAMDLIGLPYQLVIGPRGLDKGVVEFKERKSGAKQELAPEAALQRLAAV